MYREGEYGLVVGENRSCAVTLMYIAIDNCDPINQAIPTQDANSDRHIVEHAKTFAVISEGVMCSARKISTHSVLNCPARGPDWSTHSIHRTLNKPPRPGKPG